ncbi:MAG: choice-of-anchor D domain-containing protein [Solirubrobacterales bacterium]
MRGALGAVVSAALTASASAGAGSFPVGSTDPASGDIDVSPSSVAFGNQQVGTTSGAQTVTIQNTGTGPLQISTPTVGNAAFSISTDNCGPTYPRTIAPSGSCTLQLTFSPQNGSTVNSSLTISSDDPDESTKLVALSGTGIDPPNIAFDPESLDFGSQPVGVQSEALALELSNTGGSNLNVATPTSNDGEFSVAAGTCGSFPRTLAPAASCNLSVTFTPAAAGERSATLNIASNDPDDSSHDVAVSGTGQAPGAPLADALIRRSKDAAMIGNNVYEATPVTQIASWSARRRQTRSFVIELQNDGTAAGQVTASGCASTRKFSVKYLAGANDVTTVVAAGTYQTTALGPGGSVTLEAKIKPKRSSGTLACNITAFAAGSSDVVQAKLRAKP